MTKKYYIRSTFVTLYIDSDILGPNHQTALLNTNKTMTHLSINIKREIGGDNGITGDKYNHHG